MCCSYLQHPIIIGKKKHKDIQFDTEVGVRVMCLSYVCIPLIVMGLVAIVKSHCVVVGVDWDIFTDKVFSVYINASYDLISVSRFI